MRQQYWKLVALGALVLAGGVQMPAWAQTPPPHIASLTQSSGLRGTTIELKIAGAQIGQGTALMFEGAGLTVKSLTPETPPAGQQPRPEGTLAAKVHIAADAEPGWRALRVLTPMGPSDLGHFAIGLWPEAAEKEPNNARAQAQEVTLPVTVIGKLDPAEDIDCYRFHAEAGQTLVFDVFAARMESPVEPVLTVQDEDGKEVALKEDFRREDLPMVFAVPKTGNYVLVLRDLRYQGSPNHVYRLTLGATPYVTGVMPPGGAPGATLSLQLTGYNLGSAAACRITLPSETASEPFTRALSLSTGPSNPVLLTTGAFPETLQAGTNDSIATAQKLPVPATVSGRLARQNSAAGSAQADFYRFHAAQGQKLALEVAARRLGSPLDSTLTVLDTSGKELASNDDGDGADSRLEFTAPQAGDYIARIADLNRRQGPDFVYRLTVRVPEPDFRLAFAPERLAIGQGSAIPLTVTATRLNGFDGEITLIFEGLPAGVRVIGPPKIAEGQAETLLLLVAAPDAPLKASDFRITGTAALNGKTARRKAQPLLEEYVRNSNNQIERATRPSVLPRIAVTPPPDMTVTAAPDHLTLAPGKTVEIKVKIARKEGFTAKVPLALLGLPAGITATLPEIAAKQTEATTTLKIEGDAKPGDFTLIVVGKAVLDELRFVPHCALPLTLTVTK